MSKLIDFVKEGQRFGKLVLTGRYDILPRSYINVECVCDCGAVVNKRMSELLCERTKSCGSYACKYLNRTTGIKNGDKYGLITLTGVEKIICGKTRVEGICKCGVVKYYYLRSLLLGVTSSCGCLRIESASKFCSTHGLTRGKELHPIYNSWCAIKQRCFNPNSKQYPDYGGRGIGMFQLWKDEFIEFYKWSMENGWAEGLSIDRIENNNGYFPHNCRWTTKDVQSRNKRNNVILEAFGEIKCLTDWSLDSRCSVSCEAIKKRIAKGWSVEDAISIPNLKKAS